MSRYFNADKLIKELSPDPIAEMGCPEPEWLGELIDVLDSVSEEDVVEVVRCNECKYSTHFLGQSIGWCICDTFNCEVKCGDFCSYGERRDVKMEADDEID